MTTSVEARDEWYRDTHHFQDEVHGEIFLNSLERDVIDTPEFQRLFRISQVGFVRLVYPTANHTRGQHAIGTCEVAKQLVQHLNQNSIVMAKELGQHLLRRRGRPTGHLPIPPKIALSEAVLIQLGALLHDIGHGPFSHDIEKRKHILYAHDSQGNEHELDRFKSFYGPYEKHDDYEHNPAVYLALMDTTHSVLARVLQHYSAEFWKLMQRDAQEGDCDHVRKFIDEVRRAKWEQVEQEVLQSLLFDLMVFERFPEGARNHSQEVAVDYDREGRPSVRPWGLGPKAAWKALHTAWYQPYRHDIIGDTLSADLLDYLARDLKRLGIPRGMDLELLNFYVLAPVPLDSEPGLQEKQSQLSLPNTEVRPAYYRCAIDLNDYKRGTVRDYLLNDVFRLLDLRHEIHEKAVNHRVAHSAIAMLARAIMMLADKKPSLSSLVGIGAPCPALHGEDAFLEGLVATVAKHAKDSDKYSMEVTNSLPQKLVERRVYRPLMIIPGDLAKRMLQPDNYTDDIAELELMLRKLAGIVDSRFFAPFFLFVSMCLEQYLEHDHWDINELREFIKSLAAKAPGSRELGRAMSQTPKRVIIWTTPYKQLYKDPSLIVRVDDTVAEIDKLQKVARSPELRKQVEAAIQDAGMRYAVLWKLFVFISDGLYYTGTLAKLIPDHECGKRVSAHVNHLEEAQRLMVSSFRTAYIWWEQQLNSGTMVRLDSPMTPEQFQTLLNNLLLDHEYVHGIFPTLRRDVSALDLQLYLHGAQRDSCRDVRYKFDPDAAQRWSEIKQSKDPRDAYVFRLLDACNVEENELTSRLTDRELQEFRERVHQVPASLMEKADSILEAAPAAQQVPGSDPPPGLSGLFMDIYRSAHWYMGEA